MSKSIIGEHAWAEMTEVQKVEAVRSDRATLKQPTYILPERPDELPNSCRESATNPRASLEDTDAGNNVFKETGNALKKPISSKRKEKALTLKRPRRFGLPAGFSPRQQNSGRSVLLEDNVYSLPNGQEYIPKHPTGTLGNLRHLYALLTLEQFQGGRRGSVYVSNDGRIFDYSVDHADPSRDMFDTGYKISDLERTGRYGTPAGSKTR